MKKKTKARTRKTKTQFSIAEAAQRLGVHRQAVHAAITRKKLKAVIGTFTVERVVKTVQRGWVIDERDLQAYRVSARHQDAGKKND